MAMRNGLRAAGRAVQRYSRSTSSIFTRNLQYASRIAAPISRIHVASFSTETEHKEELSAEQAAKLAEEALKDEPKKTEEVPSFVPPSKNDVSDGDHKEFQAETKQLLDIVTHSIYTDKEVFLRELVSNASDALEKLRHVQVSGTTVNNPDEDLNIQIFVDQAKGTITIQDSGIGMNKEEMQSCLGVIARSGSKQFLKKAMEKNEANDIKNNLIGHFGVGFYSAFMVADHVDVFSHSATDENTYCWSSTGSGEYTIVNAGDMKRGTSIVIYLKDDQKQFADTLTIERIIKKYSNFVNFPILLNGKKVNTVQALWAMDKNSITEQQYNDFYHYVGQGFDEPLYRLHFTADAPIELKALFFVGSIQTEKMGLGRMEPGVSLYSRKVLIESKSKNLLPDWMRFIRGVVDSEDIPLSLSRENMQDSSLVQRISKILTKRFIRFLQDQRKNDYTKYLAFWNEYNHFLKEGVVQDYDHRTDLTSLLLFDSSKEENNKLCTLDEYISRAPESQKAIYFLNLPDRKYLEESPYFEVFKKKGIEVLLTYTPLDDFVINTVHEYKGKTFSNIQNTDLKLDEDTNTKNLGLNDQQAAELAGWIQTTLGNKVKTVKITHRLSDSPALISDLMNGSYRRLMQMMSQSRGEQTRDMPLEPLTLEINPNHAIIKKLYECRTEKPLIAQTVTEQLFDDCLISADLLDNPRSILPRINNLLLHSLGGDITPVTVESVKEDLKKTNTTSTETISEVKPETTSETPKN